MEVCIEAEHLSKTYGNGRTERKVLEDCSFCIEQGKLTALVGKSGCGKTTLLQILGGLLPADQGVVVADGEEIQNKTDADLCDYRAQKTGFVFQDFELLPDYTAKENICFVSDLQGLPRNPDWLEQLLESLNLKGLKTSSHLSFLEASSSALPSPVLCTISPQLSLRMSRRAIWIPEVPMKFSGCSKIVPIGFARPFLWLPTI